MKKLFIAAAIATLSLAAPAYADETSCSAESIKSVADAVAKSSGAAASTARLHLAEARASADENKHEDCVMHLNMALASAEGKTATSSGQSTTLTCDDDLVKMIEGRVLKAGNKDAEAQIHEAKASAEQDKHEDCVAHLGQALHAIGE